jgi:hypothetical protein
MEAYPVQALAVAMPVDLAAVPWSFVMAFASLALILFLYRKRPDLFADMDFTGREIALLCLGSMAGWAANFPLAIYGGTYLAVNIGGTLVPLLLVAWWIAKRKLRLGATLVGTALVGFTAWRIVEFHPEAGIVARYPAFFLPVVVALAWGLLSGVQRPLTGAPVSYASGTLGALIGADLLHILEIRQHFVAASEKTIISIGGAGVFDMVFLAGTFALALHLGVLAIFRRRRVLAPPPHAYPSTPITLRDSRKVHETFRRLEKPNGLERSLAGLALSNLALRHGDYPKSVRMSWLAVDSLLQAAPVQAHLAGGGPPGLEGDVALLRERCQAARQGVASLKDAGEANTAAKVLVSALAPHAGLRHSLEGVA